MYSVKKYNGHTKIIKKINNDEFKLEWINSNNTYYGTWKKYEIDIEIDF